MELIRLTATSWPTGAELLDVLVRPLGAVLDLNTRFSGVKPDDFTKAQPYDPKGLRPGSQSDRTNRELRIVDSPAAARELLFQLLSPSTPLIGHAIENDLNTTRIVHPCIIDTVLLFPARGGLPYRRALRTLAKDLLHRTIQVPGLDGHDSKEDAVAAGDLVRVAVGRQWRKLQSKGYKFDAAQLIAPHTANTAEAKAMADTAQETKKRSYAQMEV